MLGQIFREGRQQVVNEFKTFRPVSQINHKFQFGWPIQAVNLWLFLQQANQVARINPIFVTELHKTTALIAFDSLNPQRFGFQTHYRNVQQVTRTVRQGTEAVNQFNAEFIEFTFAT